MYKYKTHKTCSKEIRFEIDDNDILTKVEFIGGCSGNTQGVAKLCVGRNAKEVMDLLKNIPCHGNTSCPDQLSQAIAQYYSEKQ